VILFRVAFVFMAGAQKERESAKGESDRSTPTGLTGRARGILVCVAGGVIGTCFNLALVFGGELSRVALKAGASELSANNPVWCISLLGGFIPKFRVLFLPPH
jgi:hypothetical protein